MVLFIVVSFSNPERAIRILINAADRVTTPKTVAFLILSRL